MLKLVIFLTAVMIYAAATVNGDENVKNERGWKLGPVGVGKVLKLSAATNSKNSLLTEKVKGQEIVPTNTGFTGQAKLSVLGKQGLLTYAGKGQTKILGQSYPSGFGFGVLNSDGTPVSAHVYMKPALNINV